ncbi:MAG: CRISPR-associated endoribonuclease Cas6 [Lewinellaceae bacterium]|nr:CRISPR-associated endoribonuclease Cas6 [Lewinellaceae bacterium]
MQFKITLQRLSPESAIPINYQYELSAWIYKVLREADAGYADFLHRKGYTSGRKSFKLFCFSQLQVSRRRIEGDRLHLLSQTVELHLGFYLDRTAEEFVRGLFQEQTFRLGDRKSQVRFGVQTVEMRPPALPAAPGLVRIRTLSPLVIGRKNADGNDDYLHPDDPDFAPLLFLNLQEKYAAATGQPPPAWWDATRFGFRPVGQPPKSQLITIKSGTTAETRVRGWRFDFELDVPGELVEVGVLAGFGRMNSEGFGFGEVVGSRSGKKLKNQENESKPNQLSDE